MPAMPDLFTCKYGTCRTLEEEAAAVKAANAGGVCRRIVSYTSPTKDDEYGTLIVGYDQAEPLLKDVDTYLGETYSAGHEHMAEIRLAYLLKYARCTDKTLLGDFL